MNLSDFNTADASMGLKTIEFSAAINLDMLQNHHFLLNPDASNIGVSVPNMGTEAIYASFNNNSFYPILLTIGSAGTYVLNPAKSIFGYWNGSEWMVSIQYNCNVSFEPLPPLPPPTVPIFTSVAKDSNSTLAIVIAFQTKICDIVTFLPLENSSEIFCVVKHDDGTLVKYYFFFMPWGRFFGGHPITINDGSNWSNNLIISLDRFDYENKYRILKCDYINNDTVVIAYLKTEESYNVPFSNINKSSYIDVAACTRNPSIKYYPQCFNNVSMMEGNILGEGVTRYMTSSPHNPYNPYKVSIESVVLKIFNRDATYVEDIGIYVGFNYVDARNVESPHDDTLLRKAFYNVIAKFKYSDYPSPGSISFVSSDKGQSFLIKDWSLYDSQPKAIKNSITGNVTTLENYWDERIDSYCSPSEVGWENKPKFDPNDITEFGNNFIMNDFVVDDDFGETYIGSFGPYVGSHEHLQPTLMFSDSDFHNSYSRQLFFKERIISYHSTGEYTRNTTLRLDRLKRGAVVATNQFDNAFYETVHDDISNHILSYNNYTIKLLKVSDDNLFAAVYNDYYNNSYATFIMFYFDESSNTFVYSDKYVIDTTIQDLDYALHDISLYVHSDNNYLLDINNTRYHLT